MQCSDSEHETDDFQDFNDNPQSVMQETETLTSSKVETYLTPR